MEPSVVLWAGKSLSGDEAESTRRAVALLTRAGEHEAAAAFVRFLPESGHDWTPDELELGAHAGPWLGLGGGPED
jgi:hypothetical protein